MRTRSLLLLALFVLLAPTLAQAAKVRSAHDPDYDFSQVKTYRFKTESGPGEESIDRRIRGEIRAQLAKKGLRELPDGDETPDVLVNYAVGTIDHLGPGFAVAASWYYGLVAVSAGQSTLSGGILIEMGDPETGKGVWAATYIMKGTTPNALIVMIDRVEKAVRGALGKYPPRS